MTNNLISFRRINFAVIGLMLSCLFVLPVLAQPTSLRGFKGDKRLIQSRIEEAAKITSRIEKDKSNVTLYKKRLNIYGDLLQLNSDNNWDTYADKCEADLSSIIQLEKTAENYYQRGVFLTERLKRLSVANISDLYPRNSYLDLATSDFLNALQLTSAPQERQSYYTNLRMIYSIRPQKLLSVPNFYERKDEIPLEIVRQDFEMTVKYQQLAIKAGASLPYIKELEKDLLATYRANANIAEKLEDAESARKFTQAAQKYRK